MQWRSMKPLGWCNFADKERLRCCLSFVHHSQLWNRKITFHGLGSWLGEGYNVATEKKSARNWYHKGQFKEKWKKRTPKPSASNDIFARFIRCIHVNRQQTNTSSLNQTTTSFCSFDLSDDGGLWSIGLGSHITSAPVENKGTLQSRNTPRKDQGTCHTGFGAVK